MTLQTKGLCPKSVPIYTVVHFTHPAIVLRSPDADVVYYVEKCELVNKK